MVNSLNGCDSTVCIVDMERFYAVIGLFSKNASIVKTIFFNASHILLPQLLNALCYCSSIKADNLIAIVFVDFVIADDLRLDFVELPLRC